MVPVAKLFRRSLWLSLITTMALANLLSPCYADKATVVALFAQPQRVTAGETVTLSINIVDVENLYGIELHAQFDAQKLQVLPNAEGKAATPGDLMGHDFVALNAVDNTAGAINYAAAQMNPRAPASGSGALLMIRFKALAAGNAAVNFTSVILSDINGMPLAATTANTVIAILGDGATPPPATPAPGITALAPPADAPAADVVITATTAAPRSSPSAAIEPRLTATIAVAAVESQPAATVTPTTTPVAPPVATPAPATLAAADADPASPAAQSTAPASPPAVQVARAAGAPVPQPPALPEAPSRVNAAPVASTNMKNVSLLVGGVISLLIAAAALLEWRRRAPRR